MITRKQVCNIARTYENTPYHHQGRKKHVGIDCAGLVLEISRELGIFQEGSDYDGYSMNPDGFKLINNLRNHCIEKNINDMQEGDILLMRFKESPQHLAVLLEDNYIIHSYLSAKKTTIHRLNEEWKNKVVAVFSFKGVK